jgi:hypothetical protein
MTCKGICIRHKADSNNYANGQKRCQICELFIKWYGLSCPCCGYRLRNGPRLFKHKAKLRMEQKGQQIQKAQNENSSNIILHVQ